MTEQGRYSKLSEEEAAAQFEQRKQQVMGNLLEQYQHASTQKNKKQSKQQQPHSGQEFIVFNPKKKQTKQSKIPQKQFHFVKEEQPQHEQDLECELDIEQSEQLSQPIDPTPLVQSPLIENEQKKDIKKILLRDIGNLDLEIQRLTRETKDFPADKPANRSQQSQPSQHLKDSIVQQRQNPRPSSSQQSQAKPYYELRQRPSSKESRISDASYTKKAECFKGVIRSSSLKKLPQPQKPNYIFMQLRCASEKKVNQSINKTTTLESENKEAANKVVQSERKIAKPIIQINRSQSKQDTPTYEKKSTPIKSILKVQFNSIPVQCSSTKNNTTSYFHTHKESYNSQISFSKNKCVEAQIEEAVQLYNNLKSLMLNKTSVLQVRKDGNLIPRKTADFFHHKEMAKPTVY